jgi:rare lipoprotein A
MKRIVIYLLIFSAICTAMAQTQYGTASFYGLAFHGKPTASGHIYSQNELTAAHKTLPLGTVVKVTNIKNKKSVYVKINDRGPYVKGRIIDLSTKAAELLGYRKSGTAYVKVEVIKPEAPPHDVTASVKTTKTNQLAGEDPAGEEAWKSIPTVKDEVPEEGATIVECRKEPASIQAPVEKLPEPQTAMLPSREGALLNRPPYFIVTGTDNSKTGFYGVQLGVFSDASAIFGMMEELQKFKQSLLVQQETVNGKTVFKLYMGKFENRAYADALHLVVCDTYKDAQVLKYQ